jgi:ABC-type antimicrobial peptide transport system permease subunit
VAGLNVNMMIYFERQQEIGTMLAIGMKPRRLLMILLTELIAFATFVYAAATLLYGVLTVILPAGFSLGKFSALFAGSNVYINLVPSSMSIGYGIIACTMLLSAIYPLYLSTRINPVEVFREMHL